MKTQYEIWLDDDRGRRLTLVDGLSSLEIIKTVNQPGYFTITISGLDESWLAKDRMIEVWRKPAGGQKTLYFVGFLRRWKLSGTYATTLSGPGIGELLKRRIVAYAAGSSQAEKTDHADDMMKAIVRENLGASCTDTARDLSGLGLSVAADVSLGPSISKAFAYKNVLDALNEISDTAAQAGTEVFFELAPALVSDTIGMIFQTYTGQPGADRTIGGSVDPALFGLEYGNTADNEADFDASEEITVGYAGGQGEGTARVIETVIDTARAGESAWNRREAFGDARNETSTNGVTAKAQEIVQGGTAKRKFTGKLLNTESTVYGINWNFGDRVTAQYRGLNFDGIIRQVTVTMSQAGEKITASLEVV